LFIQIFTHYSLLVYVDRRWVSCDLITDMSLPLRYLFEKCFWVHRGFLNSLHLLSSEPSQWIFSFRLSFEKLLTKRVIHKVTLSSPCLSPLIPSTFIPYPLFEWCRKVKETLLNISMKCWNSAFNAQGSRVGIVVGAVKIYM
jgi:hypothetical protein